MAEKKKTYRNHFQIEDSRVSGFSLVSGQTLGSFVIVQKEVGKFEFFERNRTVLGSPLVPVTPLIGQFTIFRIIKSIKKIVVFSQTMMVFKDL